ncbi:MAG: DUF6034 family protein [Bacteroidales bacterium]|nr:DUF6034 family protein [Clostridium sp.]MCM1203599.1 DUF6034 family protein [Bacteroidales bacterium]
MKKKRLCILIFALAMLTACGKEKAVYEQEADVSGEVEISEEKEESTEQASSGDESSWTETVSTDKGRNIKIQAEITRPETADLSVMEVLEYYYTPEDKKKIAETLFDSGSQTVDTEKVLSKERLQKEIGEWDEIINLLSEGGREEDGLSEETAAKERTIAENEKRRLEDGIAEAPELSAIAEDVGDYSQDYYKGTRDGFACYLSFDMDEERNRSSWVFEVKEDMPKLNQAGSEEYIDAALVTNTSSMTKEEAEQKAVALCEEMGISNMVPVMTGSLKWIGDNPNDSAFEGYSITLTRGINGVPADPDNYTGDLYTGNLSDYVYLDSEQSIPPYDEESMVIKLTDSGIVYMKYTGILSEGKTESEVKVLSLEQIKDSFREQLKGIDSELQPFTSMDLIYLRIKNEQDENSYSYIPVWRLDCNNSYSGFGVSTRWSALMINAMDGSLINPMEQDLFFYTKPESLKTFYAD